MDCVVFGIGGTFVAEVASVLSRLQWTVRAFVSNEPGDPNPCHLEPMRPQSDVADLTALPCVLGVALPKHRHAAHAAATAAGFSVFPPVVDPGATLGSEVRLGDGSFINAAVAIGARASLGPYSVINRSSSVGHHAEVGPYAFVGPGTTLCGHVLIGAGSVVGAGSVITPQTAVGRGSFVGAGSVIHGDVPPGCAAVGGRISSSVAPETGQILI